VTFPDGIGLFQQDNALFQEWFEEHNKGFEELPWPPNYPDLNPTEHLRDVLDQQIPSMEAPPHNMQDLKDLLLMSLCHKPQTRSEVLWSPCISAPELFWQHEGDLHNISFNCFFMLWLINVYSFFHKSFMFNCIFFLHLGRTELLI